MRGSLFILSCCLLIGGCHLVLPEVSHRPIIRNPFPQLSRVAVAPFFNHSDEPTLDGRAVTMAYFSELQATPGFEVVPLNVVEEAMIAHRIELAGAGEARRLAQLLGVDAVVVGAVTDYTPYYPPRLGLHVEWYTANPGYHEIPVGYGLPWNTPAEEYIPESLVYESQLELARAQMAAQAPDCDAQCHVLPPPPATLTPADKASQHGRAERRAVSHSKLPPASHGPARSPQQGSPPLAAQEIVPVSQTETLPAAVPAPAGSADRGNAANESNATIVKNAPGNPVGAMPPFGLDVSGCLPAPTPGERPACVPHHGPVLRQTRIYRGTDPDVTQALKGYVYFRDDARFGGWQSYLQRSEDFLRFCCHMHISEMLSARGGSHKTRLVLRWPESR